MTVCELAQALNLSVISCPVPNAEVHGAYVGDLLSWVMGRAQADEAWITIMNNINVVAVASLTGVSCIILAEGVTVEESVISAAEQRGINILSTPLTSYQTACRIAKLDMP